MARRVKKDPGDWSDVMRKHDSLTKQASQCRNEGEAAQELAEKLLGEAGKDYQQLPAVIHHLTAAEAAYKSAARISTQLQSPIAAARYKELAQYAKRDATLLKAICDRNGVFW